MPRFVRLVHLAPVRPCGVNLLPILAATALLVAAAASHAQFGPSGTQGKDTSALHPPAGARVAIVEFADLECPACAKENPLLKAAAAQYKIPWVRHDFLIPGHVWSKDAALNARWFDANKGKAVGDEYRDQVFANQASIYSVIALRQFTEKFAQSHGAALPFAIDPQGKLIAGINADGDLGKRLGLNHTPTVYIVAVNGKGAPVTEVEHPDEDLYRIIEQALADTAAPASAKKSTKKTAGN
jgi:protein-disulfide isomerase